MIRYAYEIPATVLVLGAYLMPRAPWRPMIAAGFLIFLIGDVLTRRWLPAGIDAAVLALYARSWWNGSRRRKRATDALGAKSRALRDALVRKAREVVPRPGLRPVPVPS